jgi:hypothetical protein
MRRAIVALAIIAGGCATTEGLRGSEPFFAGKTAKPEQDVAGCVALAWSKAGFNLRTESATDRSSVVLAGSTPMGSDMIADIYADGRVAMHRRKAGWGGLDGKLRDQLAACL